MVSKGIVIVIITVIAAVIAGTVIWLKMLKLFTMAKEDGNRFLAVYFAIMAIMIEIIVMGAIIFVGAEISILVDPEWIIGILERAQNVNLH